MEVSGSSGGAAAVGPCASIPAEHMEFIRQVLDRVGDKWSLLLIAVVEAGPLRYTDLQRQVPGISQRMLTLTLRQLREDGLITRTAYAEVPPRVEYSLTPLGRGLHEIVTSLIGWAADHHDEIRAHRARAAAPAARS
ncbi:helix-turn-helix domain-containing protein [Streptomyces griseorubiginosus]|uniref:winged helix-turn-helix transcriptional regulator n=1 Tax=Streptomyces griseorubiginosus TaxID=67304 RepID=UPI002E8189BE|nr:helix-turn-helix domain-containing protein [Streptomyces griseorubiginosus]WUB49518.1 helix-turn-helix transcriptional regulator [Streptomyces griseorubiginosus]WUB58047.1 helix-turn-helix transcriptional regulator [Streptomyces griseorubiginosus]